MSDSGNPDEGNDEDLALRMMCGDEAALRIVLKRHLEPVRDLLLQKYNQRLQSSLVDEAVNVAILKMWRHAGSYSKTKGTLDAWFFTIAERSLLDIFRREKRFRIRNRQLDPELDEPASCQNPSVDLPKDKQEARELQDLRYVIETKLKGKQKAIILADLMAGGLADAGALAEQLGTTKNSIFVSRYKAREKIRNEMIARQQRGDALKGKK